MSLATRCSACGTVFRVVQDQLRVSGGWVRCGRCTEVFNAIESLVDLELERPGDDDAPGAHGAKVMEELKQVTRSAPHSAVAPAPPLTARAEVVEAVEAISEESNAPTSRAQTLDGAPRAEASLAAAAPPARAQARTAPPSTTGSMALDLRGQPIAPVTPEFMLQANRAARWRRPQVRAALASLGLAATALLTAQALIAWHDLAAARWPALVPAIAQLCNWEGCVIEPPRRIDSLTVDSSGLVRTGSADTYGLALVMRNREASMALRLPSIDLTLTNALGQTMARRVINPAALGIALPSIAAGSELGMAGILRIDAGDVAGYTIELFYP